MWLCSHLSKTVDLAFATSDLFHFQVFTMASRATHISFTFIYTTEGHKILNVLVRKQTDNF